MGVWDRLFKNKADPGDSRPRSYLLRKSREPSTEGRQRYDLVREYDLEEVFTPGQPADKGFVRRPAEETLLANLLQERGTQILVWGESGAGKTSLARKVLEESGQPFITTRCETTTSYEQILSSGFERIKAMRKVGTSKQDNRTVGGGTELGGTLSPASVNAHTEWEVGQTDDYATVVAAQITSESLALRLGEKGFVWLIEDFHKVAPEVRLRLADAMKVFSDESPNFPKLRMVVLGVAETATQILRAPSNMTGRLADLRLPPLTDDELGGILDTGNRLLNVDFAPVRERLIHHSVGIASVTHALARECCIAVGVRKTSPKTVAITPAALEIAKSAYTATRGGDFKDDFDVAMEVKVTRTYANHAIILRALASLPERGATHAQIQAEILKTHAKYPPGNLTKYLRELQTEDRKALVRRTSEGVFRFDRPLQHAYAKLRFDVPAREEEDFWSSSLSVSREDQEESVRLALEENPEAPAP
ncbi:ATP-binding protein [Frigoribacterium sp. NPDC087798]|uniref:ATP-binding protein n=1 Tax=Frigoribacterium sp. NPDC087798 TaxID=3363993 RepID=UPI0038104185